MRTLIVNAEGKLSIEETAMPKYGEYQALVKMISCGVCNGTDTKLIHRNFKGFLADRDYPLMLGHEGVGKVIEVGAKVKGYKIGDVVLLPFVDANDEYKSGWGAYGEYGVVTDYVGLESDGIALGAADFPECAYGQLVVPPEIDAVDAAMIITLREVLSSIKTFGVTANSSVVVFGCGPVGLTFIKFMSLLGVHPIIALDIEESKMQEALKKGANYVLNSKKDDVSAEIRKICPDGVDFVIDAVGVLAIINQAMGLIKDRGHICCYGISPHTKFEIDWTDSPYNWNLCFQQMPSKKEEGEAHNQILAWLKGGVIDLKDYISDYMDFDDVIAAFEKVEKREIKKKCIIKY